MLESIRELWDTFTLKKYNLVRDNVNNTYTSENVSKVLLWEILDPTLPGNMPIDNTALNLSIKKLLELQGIDIKSFEWQKILDIWWWFTGLPFLLADINSEVNIVDPIFLNNVQSEVSRNQNKILKLINDFDERNYEHFKKWNKEKQEYLYRLNYEFNLILSDLRKWYWIRSEDNNFSVWKTNVNILPTTWEEISTLDWESMDTIFINHTITKNQVNPHALLEKAYELLKTWWKIYITESWKMDFNAFKIFNTEFKVEVINSYYLNDKTILILEKI